MTSFKRVLSGPTLLEAAKELLHVLEYEGIPNEKNGQFNIHYETDHYVLTGQYPDYHDAFAASADGYLVRDDKDKVYALFTNRDEAIAYKNGYPGSNSKWYVQVLKLNPPLAHVMDATNRKTVFVVQGNNMHIYGAFSTRESAEKYASPPFLGVKSSSLHVKELDVED